MRHKARWLPRSPPPARKGIEWPRPLHLESEYRPTGCVILDLDHVGGAEAVAEAREAAARVAQDGGLPHTIAAWVSPSGDGLKVAVHVTPMPKTPAEHRAAWATATDLYAAALGIEVDPQTPDVSRVKFLSYDQGLIEGPANLRPTLASSRESDDRRLTCMCKFSGYNGRKYSRR